MVLFKHNIQQCKPLFIQVFRYGTLYIKPFHLICFKEWTPSMVNDIICSALNLKLKQKDTHNSKLCILPTSKVMILQEVNQPVLCMAVSKAASFLGADDVVITDHVVWDEDYNGLKFSCLSDVIFVSTATHMCVQRFADTSAVPVICMHSRTHSSLLSLATIMTLYEEYGCVKNLNIAYIGAPHPVLNSYLLLCPMLGANIKFKCCCPTCPVSPLLLKASEDFAKTHKTHIEQCTKTKEVLEGATAIISGPTTKLKEKIPEFTISVDDLYKNCHQQWIYFHTCPRGEEVQDSLFWHSKSRTFCAVNNLQYIAGALMAKAIKQLTF